MNRQAKLVYISRAYLAAIHKCATLGAFGLFKTMYRKDVVMKESVHNVF